MDIIHRLNALGSGKHDDLSIGFEAAATIIDMRLENKEQAQEIEKLRAALNAIAPISCHQLHHDKQDRHAPGDPCPVEVRIEALRWARSE